MNQRVLYIMDIGVLSPMLGLLGTVAGILQSFSKIASDDMGSRANVLAGGVSQALVATGIGLVVGLTAMAAYAFFRGRVNHLVSLLETHSTLLVHEIIAMKTRYRRRKGL
jgi:biopolymer transport protein ExbB